MAANPIPTEHAEQCDLMRWADSMTFQHSELHLLHAIPNGGARARATASKLKAEGVKPGVPDLFLPCARGTWHGLYIEMKRSKGGSTSAVQKWWHTCLIGSGFYVQVCKSAAEAQAAILAYLKEPTRGPKFLILNPPPAKTASPKLTTKARVTDYRRSRPHLNWTSTSR